MKTGKIIEDTNLITVPCKKLEEDIAKQIDNIDNTLRFVTNAVFGGIGGNVALSGGRTTPDQTKLVTITTKVFVTVTICLVLPVIHILVSNHTTSTSF